MRLVEINREVDTKRDQRLVQSSKCVGGFTLIEVLMGILLIVLLSSISGVFLSDSKEKFRVDQTVYVTQSIVSAAQYFYLSNREWPGTNRNRIGDRKNEKCADGFVDIVGGYLGGIATPDSHPTLQAISSPLNRELIIRCTHVDGTMTLDQFWVRQCIPDDWMGYVVNALANTKRLVPSVNNTQYPRSYLRCDAGDAMVETLVPVPGRESYTEGFVELTGSVVTKPLCAAGLRAELYLAPLQICQRFINSGLPQLGDEKDLAGISFEVLDEGVGWRLEQHLARTVAEVSGIAEGGPTYQWSDEARWVGGLTNTGGCSGGQNNRFRVWKLCQ
ncbi:MAG: type II secretion system GspH family protein [Pseudomonadales bacterium]|nr:type II secretion system GspH family protein [Pseudomonadales bacterium]